MIKTSAEFTLDDCEKYLKIISDNLETKGIKQDVEKIRVFYETNRKKSIENKSTKNNIAENKLNVNPNFHPISHLVYSAENHLKQLRQIGSSEITETLFKICMLGQKINLLTSKNILESNERILDLMNTDHKHIVKTQYEIDVSIMLMDLGYDVEFKKTQPEKSIQMHDILVNKNLEIECKRQDVNYLSSQNLEFFNQIITPWKKLYKQFLGSYLITIHLNSDLTKNIVHEINNTLYHVFIEQKFGDIVISNGKITIFKIADAGEVVKTQIRIPNTNIIVNLFDEIKKIIQTKVDYQTWHNWMKNGHHLEILSKGKSMGDMDFLEDFHYFQLKLPGLPRRISGVRSLLNKAKKQFTKKNPSIVFVNMDYDPELVIDDFKTVGMLVDDFLRQNSSITAVVVTVELMITRNGKLSHSYDGKVFFNKNPRIPLLEEIDFFNQESHVYDEIKQPPSVAPGDGDVATFSYLCTKCQKKHFVQANLVQNAPLINGMVKFPKNNILICGCGEFMDLTESRKLIEEQTGCVII